MTPDRVILLRKSTMGGDMTKVAVFDADGTLFDTEKITVLNLRRTGEALNIKTKTEDELVGILSRATSEGIAEGIGIPAEQRMMVIRTFFKISMESPDDLSQPYPGIRELLGRLRSEGYLLAVASLKIQPLLERLIRNFGMEFDSVHGVTGESDTKAGLIRACLQDLGASAGDAVMIGDTENDRKASEEVGTAFIPVSYGFGFKGEEGVADASAVEAEVRRILG